MAPKTIVTEKPVVLEGFQAVMKPSKFGYTLSAILSDESIIEQLEQDRGPALEWAKSKLKNPKRALAQPEPWEEVEQGKYKVKFSWKDEDKLKPTIVDSEGTVLRDPSIPLYSGSVVKLAFFQKPYTKQDGFSYGTSLKLQGVQVISISSSAGVDSGDMNEEDVAELFGKTKGFKADDPNVTPAPAAETDVDF